MLMPASDPSGPRRKISAIIACYRDAPAVPQMYERLVDVFHKIAVEYERQRRKAAGTSTIAVGNAP